MANQARRIVRPSSESGTQMQAINPRKVLFQKAVAAHERARDLLAQYEEAAGQEHNAVLEFLKEYGNRDSATGTFRHPWVEIDGKRYLPQHRRRRDSRGEPRAYLREPGEVSA